MRFAISTHVFHGDRLARRHFEALAAHGFDQVELFATRTHLEYHDSRHVDEVAGWLASCGLRAPTMHLPISMGVAGAVWGRPLSNAATDAAARREAVDETVAALDAASRLGCAVGVLHLGIPRGQPADAGDNDLGSVKRSLETLVERAGASGVRLALEVMPNDLSTPEALLALLDGDLGRAGTGICLDVGHAHLLGGAPDAAELLSGHVVTTHLHDNRGRDDDHLVPFDGSVDWPATLTALGKTGFDGPLVLEVDGRGDPDAVLGRTVGARARLQAILDELTAPFEFTE